MLTGSQFNISKFENKDYISPAEKNILYMYRCLDKRDKEEVVNTIKFKYDRNTNNQSNILPEVKKYDSKVCETDNNDSESLNFLP